MSLDVLILRDARESARKCSLTPLRGMEGVRFVAYDRDRRVDAGGRILLHPEGEEFGEADRGRGLLVLDCAWRRVPALLATVDGDPPRRRLPALATAYPRKSRSFEDPERGLASIEALYAALALLGEARPDLLAGYRWSAEFFRLNPALSRAERSSLAAYRIGDSASPPITTAGRPPTLPRGGHSIPTSQK